MRNNFSYRTEPINKLVKIRESLIGVKSFRENFNKI